MDQELADKIRERYREGVSVVEIATRCGESRRTIYDILNNRTFRDDNYRRPIRPKDVVRQFGKQRILNMADDGARPEDICETIASETGSEISVPTLRWWLSELRIAREREFYEVAAPDMSL